MRICFVIAGIGVLLFSWQGCAAQNLEPQKIHVTVHINHQIDRDHFTGSNNISDEDASVNPIIQYKCSSERGDIDDYIMLPEAWSGWTREVKLRPSLQNRNQLAKPKLPIELKNIKGEKYETDIIILSGYYLSDFEYGVQKCYPHRTIQMTEFRRGNYSGANPTGEALRNIKAITTTIEVAEVDVKDQAKQYKKGQVVSVKHELTTKLQ